MKNNSLFFWGFHLDFVHLIKQKKKINKMEKQLFWTASEILDKDDSTLQPGEMISINPKNHKPGTKEIIRMRIFGFSGNVYAQWGEEINNGNYSWVSGSWIGDTKIFDTKEAAKEYFDGLISSFKKKHEFNKKDEDLLNFYRRKNIN